jgi:beta-phosphoglucomutase
MLKAILFDFDGVLADTEPLHFHIFQKVLSEEGIGLSKHEYYAKYIGLDDKGCFQSALSDYGNSFTPERIKGLVDRKAGLFREYLKTSLTFYPGVNDFVRQAAAHYRLAIVSGALRTEIDYSLESAGIEKHFEHITAAEDVTRGKPDPEGYLLALRQLNLRKQLVAAECLVIEDTPPGIQAACAASMHCLAVTNSFPSDHLLGADAITSTLEGYDLASFERQFRN